VGAQLHAGVQRIPFLVLDRDGWPVAGAVGLQPKHVLGQAATDAVA
jgi:thioredoxin-like negative regulator of GroEL